MDSAVPQWAIDDSISNHIIRVKCDINASAAKVWAVVRDVNNYKSFTKSISAESKNVQVGESVILTVNMGFPLFTQKSTETIDVVDEINYAISWKVSTRGTDEKCTRWQIVIPSTNDSNKCTYITALHIPTILLIQMAALGIKGKILHIFTKFSEDLKTRCSLSTTVV